ncbi:MAG: hypothetical protein ACOYOF_03490 [Verrucomicrobiaceae bacterium]
MPFDPTYPATNALIESAPLREQFQGLKALLDNLPVLANAVVDAVVTDPPGSSALVQVYVSQGTLHFTFNIPQGLPGEVTLLDAQNLIAAQSSANSNAVSTLGLGVNEPPTGPEVQQIVNKLDELILALRR